MRTRITREQYIDFKNKGFKMFMTLTARKAGQNLWNGYYYYIDTDFLNKLNFNNHLNDKIENNKNNSVNIVKI